MFENHCGKPAVSDFMFQLNKLRVQSDGLFLSLMVCDWMMHLNLSVEG